MSRLATRFEKLKSQQRKALVSYVMAGDPQPQVTVPLLHKMVDAGVDVIELGLPFSDPMADGQSPQLVFVVLDHQFCHGTYEHTQ